MAEELGSDEPETMQETPSETRLDSNDRDAGTAPDIRNSETDDGSVIGSESPQPDSIDPGIIKVAPDDRLPTTSDPLNPEPLHSEPLHSEPLHSEPLHSEQHSERNRGQHLDPRWIRLQRIMGLFTVLVLAVVTAVVGVATFALWTMPWTILVPVLWGLALIAGGFIAIKLPTLSYERWSYRIDERVIQVSHGIVWRATLAIPMSRLQHVDLHRGPIERRFGLSSLEIHTAGTRSASHLIPGLNDETAIALRDRLIDAANRGADVNNAE